MAAFDSSVWTMLSLLPFRLRRFIGDSLRAGDSPDAILDSLLAALTESRSSFAARAAAALARADAAGLDAVPWSDPRYPPALAAIFDPPPLLWVRGVMRALDAPAVAIVGSRAASPYALAVAERLAADLASCGVVVVSGMARGVDSAAHRGALAGVETRRASSRGDGVCVATIAVLGSGADVIYPPEHRTLASSIMEAGAIVSELAPGARPLPYFFPLRNRIISGLSRAVVVIEAGDKSGSLITARAALEQGREVLAVPGNVLSGRNRGTHGLLRDGAKIVESADDILEELGPSVSRDASGAPERPAAWTTPADPILACLTPGEPCDLDAIAERSGLAPARVLPRLFDLEMQGLVARAGGGRFVRFDRTC